MTPSDDTDRVIDEVAGWIIRAGEALLSFYDTDQAGFVRDTVAPGRTEAPHVLGRTASSRAFTALLELLHFLAEEDTGAAPGRSTLLRDRASEVVRQMATEYFATLPTEPERVRASSQNGINMFTDSHVVLAVTCLRAAGVLAQAGTELILPEQLMEEIFQSATSVWSQSAENLRAWNGGRIHPGDQSHDFVTLHAVRAGDAIGLLTGKPPEWDPAFGIRTRNAVLLQLGRHSAGITSQFDPAELAFSVALLNRFGSPDHQPMTLRALQVIDSEQTSDGAWPTSRLVSYGNNYLLFPASFEVALTLADLLVSQLDRGVQDGVELLLRILGKTLNLVTNTYMTLDRQYSWTRDLVHGWANDRVRSPERLESWATAIVLSFLIRYRESLLRVRQARILAQYDVLSRSRESFAWPDLAPILGVQNRPNPRALDLVSDPTDEGKLAETLKAHFVLPTLASSVQRPTKVSLLLPGPPGTRKTSMVKRLAEALGWPLITLTPPDFLGSGGLEQFEVSAAGVFRDLMRLRRVVVLFDECEDFFRKRETSAGSAGGRTMGAFITAGMLPRLQRLYEHRWIIFVLATNAQLEELDPAAIRQGRFDYQQEMRNPPLKAQRRYVEARLSDKRLHKLLDSALVDWAGRARQHRSHEDDGEITFSALDQLIARVNAMSENLNETALRAVIVELTKPGPPLLIA